MVKRRYAFYIMISFAVSTTTIHSSIANTLNKQEEFLRNVKYIADHVDGLDPEAVGIALHTKLTITRQSSNKFPCSSGVMLNNSRRLDSVNFIPTDDFWFHSEPDGVQAMIVPGFISSSITLGQPNFSYNISHTTTCGDERHPGITENTSEISFSAIPGFTCITEDQLRAIITKVNFIQATDGGWPYEYIGRHTERKGTDVSFDYVYKPQCLISLRIRQSPAYGNRSLRARSKMNTCMSKAGEELRKTGKNFSTGDEIDACKPYWDYFAEEPERD